MFMFAHVFAPKRMFRMCVGFLGVHVLPSLCALMLSTVWPSLVLPAVLTLVCVDSKHSCRSQGPRSGQTRGSEGQWRRGERAYRERGEQEREGGTRGKKAVLWSGAERWRGGRSGQEGEESLWSSTCPSALIEADTRRPTEGRGGRGREVVRRFCGQTCCSKGQERDDERGGEKQKRVREERSLISGINFHLRLEKGGEHENREGDREGLRHWTLTCRLHPGGLNQKHS